MRTNRIPARDDSRRIHLRCNRRPDRFEASRPEDNKPCCYVRLDDDECISLFAFRSILTTKVRRRR